MSNLIPHPLPVGAARGGTFRVVNAAEHMLPLSHHQDSCLTTFEARWFLGFKVLMSDLTPISRPTNLELSLQDQKSCMEVNTSVTYSLING